jgi:hypothetical protein
MMVTVANGPYVGAALTLAPNARLDDRRFDVQVFTRFGKLELLGHLLSIAGGRRAYNPKVRTFRARTVQIEAQRPMMVHADSQPLGSTPARFEIVPSSLSVVVGGESDCLPALAKLPPATSSRAQVVVPGARAGEQPPTDRSADAAAGVDGPDLPGPATAP